MPVVVRREETRTAERGRGKACISVRMKLRVEFGEHVAVLGSSEAMGGWERKVPMTWTEEGWVSELEIEKGKRVEYKFVIVGGDGKLVWEGGGNRVLGFDKGGRFEMVCHWDKTGETDNVVQLEEVDEEDEGVVDGGDDASVAAEASSVSEMAPNPFVQDWQGRAAEFMRSNEHRSREVDRRWNTEGLEGLVLRLVEGDKSARNWWRKVWSGCVCVFDDQ